MNIETQGWITLEQAAKYLSVSRSYLYQRGSLIGVPRVKLGNSFRYRTSDLDAWLLGKFDEQDS